jgi:dihydrofolate reductase
MRKVTLGLANSLDNYIARKDGGSDWLTWDNEVAKMSAKFMKTVDAILIGRKTYDVMLAAGENSYPGATNYVFSRSKIGLSQFNRRMASGKAGAKRPKIEFISEDAAAFVRKLKDRKGKGIVVFGGGELARSLFAADLIDEIVLNIQPVLLGSGIPLFHPMKEQINLKLLRSQQLKNGGIVLTYRIKH